MKILIVDDHGESRLITEELLVAAGHDVTACSDGESALETARTWQPDLVISDVMVPQRDGYSLCMALKSDPNNDNAAFVFYSGTYLQPDEEKLGFDLGASRFLTKPMEAAEFLGHIEQIVGEITEGRVPRPRHDADTFVRLNQQYSRILSLKLEEKMAALDREHRALESSHALNSLILATTADAIVAVDINDRVLFANEAACRLFERQEHELTELAMSDLMPERFRAAHQSAFSHYVKTGVQRMQSWKAVSLTILTGNGKEIPVEVSFGEHNSGGQRLFIGTLRDMSSRKAFEEAANLSQRIISTTSDMIAVVDKDYVYQMVNKAYLETFHKSHGAIVGHTVAELVGEDNFNTIVKEKYDRSFEGETVYYHAWFDLPGIGRHYMDLCYYPNRATDGTIVGAIVFVRDITQQKTAEEALNISNRAVEASINGIVITDSVHPERPIVYVNPAFCKMTGFTSQEVVGQNPRFLFRNDRNQAGLEHMRKAVREHTSANTVVRNYRKNGEMFWNNIHVAPVFNEDGKLTHYVGVSTDVTEQVHYEEELRYRATHDTLTGMANRNLLYDRLNQAILLAERNNECIAVLFLDIDRFKQVNDTLGHSAGDDLLRQVSERIQERLRKADTVARHSGDEFVIVLTAISNPQTAENVAREIHHAIGEPYRLQGHEVVTTCSIGISVYPQDSKESDILLRNADIAMYRAKELGRNAIEFFTHEMSSTISERMALEVNLRRAIERREFHLHYQPQFNLNTGRIIGAEALLRWHSNEHGWIPPAKFIPISEDTGMIIEIGEWVLKEACRQLVAWREAGVDLDLMAVNVSGMQIHRGDFLSAVEQALEENGLEPQSLELEVTESVVMRHAEAVIDTMNKLNTLGVSLAVDDFGTGYSSLSYLKRLPLHKLKIDQSFVKDIPDDSNDTAIARAVIALGKSLQLRVIAEGIETDEQRIFLSHEGCDDGQGYLFSRPLPPENILALLQDPPDILRSNLEWSI